MEGHGGWDPAWSYKNLTNRAGQARLRDERYEILAHRMLLLFLSHFSPSSSFSLLLAVPPSIELDSSVLAFPLGPVSKTSFFVLLRAVERFARPPLPTPDVETSQPASLPIPFGLPIPVRTATPPRFVPSARHRSLEIQKRNKTKRKSAVSLCRWRPLTLTQQPTYLTSKTRCSFSSPSVRTPSYKQALV